MIELSDFRSVYTAEVFHVLNIFKQKQISEAIIPSDFLSTINQYSQHQPT